MGTLKYSRQREAILNFLMTRKDHPTADVIYDNIRKAQPNISLGTVYRNLSLLAEIGEIQRLTTGDGKDHFDGNAMPHDHFVCRMCNSVIDVNGSVDHKLDKAANKTFDGEIEGHTTIYYGKCRNCIDKQTRV